MNVIRKAFVTGGSGAIGRNLLPALSGSGVKLRLLRRATELPSGDAEIVDGDIRDFKSEWLEDVDVVFHLAAKTVPSGKDGSMEDINAIGTEQLVKAIKNTKHKPRLVFTSSVAVYGPSGDRLLMTSDSPANPITDYGRSKLRAEKAVLSYDNSMVARLPMVVGPGDRVTGRFNKLAAMGVFPITPGRFCAISAGDAVRLLYCLATTDCGDRRIYTATDGEIYDWKSVARYFARKQHRSVTTFRLPEILLRPRLFALLGNADAALYLKHDWICRPNYPDGFAINDKVFAGGACL